MNIILFDDPDIRLNLLPFTFTRPVGDIRVGILTVAEKWKWWTKGDVSFQTEAYLAEKFPEKISSDNYFINGAICPDKELCDRVINLKNGEGLKQGEVLLAARSPDKKVPGANSIKCENYSSAVLIDQVWKIFQLNGSQIKSDFRIITVNRKSIPISDIHTRCYNSENIFLEDGASVKAAILNAEAGPIYLGKNSQIHEGAIIKGPFALGEGSHVNMGAKVRGDTSVGPFSKIGGEVSNCVIFGYSNKAHDGFLGNSVIGEWCNLGADTNTSNLKNSYENIKIWNYKTKGFKDTGLMFCGLMLGDHSKCGINTMFNTGTVVGVNVNIFGEGYPRTIIPSFAWGGAAGYSTYKIGKALETAAKAMERRNVALSETDKKIMEEVYRLTAEDRVWEK